MSKAAELAALIGSQSALSNRNMIINGAFQCWQRSTSVSSQTGSGYQTTDRWRTNASGGTYNQSRQTVPLGDSVVGDFKYFLRHEVTTGDNFTGIQQRIEDVQSVPEGTLTLSFYAKGTNPNAGSITIGTNQYFGTGGSPSSNVEVTSAATLTLTSSWQRFNFQLTVASISGKTLGTNNDSYFQIQFTQDGNDTSTDAWTLDITGVQLELGETATPFEHRSFGDELAACQRYFMQWNSNNASREFVAMCTYYDDDDGHGIFQTPVSMRTYPSISYNDLAVFKRNSIDTTSVIVNSTTSPIGDSNTVPFNMDNAGGLNAGEAFFVGFSSTTVGYIKLDSEL